MHLPRIIVPLVTPRKDGLVDKASLAKLSRFQVDNHLSAVFLLGTTGEFNKMALADKKALLGAFYVVGENCKKPPFSVVGVSAEDVAETLALIAYCAQKNYRPDAFVFAPLFGVGDPEEKIKRLLKSTTRPILLYNNPAIHGGINVPVGLLRQLATHSQILGIKDSSGNRDYFNSLLPLANAGFHIYQGSGAHLMADLNNVKITGIIPGTANIIPLVFHKLVTGIDVNVAQEELGMAKKRLAQYPSYIQGLKAMLYDKGILASAEDWIERE